MSRSPGKKAGVGLGKDRETIAETVETESKGKTNWKIAGTKGRKENEGNELEKVWTEIDVEKCRICHVRVGESQMGLNCDMCKAWFHVDCMEIKKVDYKKMMEINESARIKWFCVACEWKVDRIHTENQVKQQENSILKEENREVKILLAQLIEKVNDLEKTLDLKIEQYIDKKTESIQRYLNDNMKKVIDRVERLNEEVMELKTREPKDVQSWSEQERNKEIEQMKKEVVREGVKEMRKERDEEDKRVKEISTKIEEIEKERKKKNLIIFGLHESQEEEAGKRYEDDERKCNQIFMKELQLQNVEMEKLIRIGRKNENRNRPLLVKMANEEERLRVLRNAKRLRYSEEFQRVYIDRDMTAMEREKDKKLRKELKEKREKEDAWYIIRKGKVIRAEEINRTEPERSNAREVEQPQAVRPKEGRKI